MKLLLVRSLSVVSAAVIAVAFVASHANPRTEYVAEGVVPTPIEVARAMAGPQFKPRIKTRGLAVAAAEATIPSSSGTTLDSTPSLPQITSSAATAAATKLPAPPTNTSVLAVAVPFAFDSSRLSSAANPVLDSIAEGIKLLGNGARVVIEGHTDVRGQSGYNRRLSMQRAQSVKRYLVLKHGISPNALSTIGKGGREPLSGFAPTARENRRVQFRLA